MQTRFGCAGEFNGLKVNGEIIDYGNCSRAGKEIDEKDEERSGSCEEAHG